MTLTWENGRYWRKTFSSVTLSTANPTWTGLGLNTGLLSDTLATNYLSHGIALCPV
jgi:hypothetical protein